MGRTNHSTDQGGKLRIAYAIQNVGGIDFRQDIGDTVPVKYTLRGLKKAGHTVTCLMLTGRSVLGIDDISNYPEAWKAPLGISGTGLFRGFESGVRWMQRRLKLPYFALFDLFRFYEACCRVFPEYDLCHEHNGLFSAGAALACSRLGLPYVLTVSAEPLFERELGGRPLKGIHKKAAAWEARYTYQKAERILCVSEPAKRNLTENWQVDPEKIVVMPNGVDCDLFHPDYDSSAARHALGLADEPTIGFVGGFQHWHGIELLVESFSEVLEKIPEARLILVGDGRARGSIEKKIEECGVRSAVTITGIVPQRDVPVMLAAIDVAVLPYPDLPMELWFSPLKLYEYMAAGKAITASASGQIAEVIEDGVDGILVPPGDITVLAERLIELLKDAKLRSELGRRARQKAIEHHSWDNYITKLESVYRDVLKWQSR